METTKSEGMPVSAESRQPRSFADLTEQRTAGLRLAVRFLRRWSVYFGGDVAVFPQRTAQRLVNDGFAERVNVEPGPAPPGGMLAIRYPIPLEERRRNRDER